MEIKLTLEKDECIKEINTMLKNLPLTNSKMEVSGAELVIQQLSVTGFKMYMRELIPRISIAFEVTKKTLLAKLVGQGIVSVVGQIQYNIDEDFIFSGKFKYLSHDWIDDPDISIGLINLPVKSLVNSMIEKQTSKIEDLINSHLGATDLKIWIKPYISFLQQQVKLKHSYVSIDAIPTALRINTIDDTNDAILMQADLIAGADITFGKKQDLTDEMPKLYLGPALA